MPDLIVCPQCGQTVSAAAPAGQCAGCLLRLGLAGTGGFDDTPPTARHQDAPTKKFASEAATQEAPGADHTTAGDAGAPDRVTRFGNYQLREEVGRGGMGVVYRAVQAIADREVAVKILLGGAAGEALFGGRFAAEASALAQLRHPNIITVYEVGKVNGSGFFSMEYAPNGTLAQRLKAAPLPLGEAALLIGKLADATEAAHRLGVLHRDIKPGNVLIAADGEPKLSDFGLAKWTNSDGTLTETGAAMGTPSYMPPEQARSAKDVGPAADVYALGATLYECLTGRPPFRGPDAYTVMQRVLTQDPDPPRAVRSEIPCDLEAVCLKCLNKEPANRYASARELADDLTRWRNGEPTVARPLTGPQRIKRRVVRRWKSLAAALVLALGGGAAALSLAWFDPERRVDRAMRNDERVTLIGPTGPPKWHRWAVGAGDFPPGEPNLPFQLATNSVAYLELAKDTYTDHYRLSAEFRIESSTQSNSWGGIYVGWRRGTVTHTGTVSRAIAARHREDRLTNQPMSKVKGDPIALQDHLIVTNAQHPHGYEEPAPLGAHWSGEVELKDRGYGLRGWRYLEIEVHPERVTARWREKSGELSAVRQSSGRPAESISTRTIEQATVRHETVVQQLFPELLPGPPSYQPRGAVGVYASNGVVAFRNVVFERLEAAPSP